MPYNSQGAWTPPDSLTIGESVQTALMGYLETALNDPAQPYQAVLLQDNQIDSQIFTDAVGNYFAVNMANPLQYTLEPVQGALAILPSTATVALPSAGVVESNFTAALIGDCALSGTVLDQAGNPLVNVLVMAEGFSTVTNGEGAYNFSQLPLGGYEVRCLLSGYGFEVFNVEIGGTVTQNFTGTVQTSVVSGNVEYPLVMVTLGDLTTLSDFSGNYSFPTLPAGISVLAPSKMGLSFSPQTITVPSELPATGQNFSASISPGTVYGQVVQDGVFIAGVTMNLTGASNLVTVTNTVAEANTLWAGGKGQPFVLVALGPRAEATICRPSINGVTYQGRRIRIGYRMDMCMSDSGADRQSPVGDVGSDILLIDCVYDLLSTQAAFTALQEIGIENPCVYGREQDQTGLNRRNPYDFTCFVKTADNYPA